MVNALRVTDSKSRDWQKVKMMTNLVATEGRKIAVVTGDTFTVKEKLKGAGWKWQPEVKGWAKDVPAEWEAWQVEADIRGIAGIRNRMGKVTISFEG